MKHLLRSSESWNDKPLKWIFLKCHLKWWFCFSVDLNWISFKSDSWMSDFFSLDVRSDLILLNYSQGEINVTIFESESKMTRIRYTLSCKYWSRTYCWECESFMNFQLQSSWLFLKQSTIVVIISKGLSLPNFLTKGKNNYKHQGYSDHQI